MIPFENTDLHIIELESDDNVITRLYLLNEVVEGVDFSVDDFVAEMDEVLPKADTKPELFDQLLDRMNVIEIFDQEDIEDLIDEGFVDPDDLHQSLYDFLATEDEDGLFDEDEMGSI
ncbi:hypothetical protein EP331_08990 [bacterium]|nr:MAG: hypothetical protein EP331_08990 [bacterium]